MADRGSLLDTADQEPWEYYDQLLAAGGGGWDEGLKAWVIASYEGCNHVLRKDKQLFHHPAEDASEVDDYRVIEGPMQVAMMQGDLQTRVHNWWVREFRRGNVDAKRESLIQPLANGLIDRFAHRGHAELATELVDEIPVRVISAILGLPWTDDAFVRECKALLDVKLEYFNRVRTAHAGGAPGTPEEQAAITRAMHLASQRLDALVLPTVAARRVDRLDDVISRLWNDGPSLLPTWGENEMCSAVKVILFGGSDTTTHALCNGLYMLLTQPGLADEVRTRGEQGLVSFTEEILRLAGSVHFRARVANVDQELNGLKIAKDDTVIVLSMAANRDPQHYGCPLAVDLDRSPSPQDHLAFNLGPRHCVGAALARAEIQETMRVVLARLSGLRLDPEAEPPSFVGFVLRGYRPLHALFESADVGLQSTQV